MFYCQCYERTFSLKNCSTCTSEIVGTTFEGSVSHPRKTPADWYTPPSQIKTSTVCALGSTSQYSSILARAYKLFLVLRSCAEVPGDRISTTRSGAPTKRDGVILSRFAFSATTTAGGTTISEASSTSNGAGR